MEFHASHLPPTKTLNYFGFSTQLLDTLLVARQLHWSTIPVDKDSVAQPQVDIVTQVFTMDFLITSETLLVLLTQTTE